jgi:hypothetical protein
VSDCVVPKSSPADTKILLVLVQTLENVKMDLNILWTDKREKSNAIQSMKNMQKIEVERYSFPCVTFCQQLQFELPADFG